MEAEKDAGAPERTRAQHCNKHDPNKSPGDAAFAPALEHSNHSNDKENNSDAGDRLDPHECHSSKHRGE